MIFEVLNFLDFVNCLLTVSHWGFYSARYTLGFPPFFFSFFLFNNALLKKKKIHFFPFDK